MGPGLGPKLAQGDLATAPALFVVLPLITKKKKERKTNHLSKYV